MRPASSPACRTFFPSGTSKLWPLGCSVTLNVIRLLYLALSAGPMPRGFHACSEVRAADVVARSELGGRAFGRDAALVEHIRAPRELERHGDILLHEEHCDARAIDFADGVEEVAHDQRREAQRRFVE